MSDFYLKGFLLYLGWLGSAATVSIVEVGSWDPLRFAKLALMFDGGPFLGPVFTWLWGWPVWWANIMLLFAWLAWLTVFYAGYKERKP